MCTNFRGDVCPQKLVPNENSSIYGSLENIGWENNGWVKNKKSILKSPTKKKLEKSGVSREHKTLNKSSKTSKLLLLSGL